MQKHVLLPLRSDVIEEEGENNLACNDLEDQSTNDETGRRCKTGDWREFGRDEEHRDLFDGENGNCWSKWWAIGRCQPFAGEREEMRLRVYVGGLWVLERLKKRRKFDCIKVNRRRRKWMSGVV